MSKINYVDGVKIIKHKKNNTAFVMFVLFASVLLVYLMSGIFSKALSVTEFSFINMLGLRHNEITAQKHTIYAVTLGEYDDHDKALSVAMGASLAGAGGYVWKENDKFFVIGHVYPDKKDAEIVAENLSFSEYNISVMDVKISAVKVYIENFGSKNSQKINEILKYLYQLYENFYKNTIQFEKQEITYFAFSSFVNSYKGEVRIYQDRIDEIIKEYPSKSLTDIKSGLIAIESSLDNTVKVMLENNLAISIAKYGLIEYVYQYQRLINNLQN